MGLKLPRRLFFLDPPERLYVVVAVICYRLSVTGCSMQEVLFFSTFGTVYCVPIMAKPDRTRSRKSYLGALIYLIVQIVGTCLTIGGVALARGGVGPLIREVSVARVVEVLLSFGWALKLGICPGLF